MLPPESTSHKFHPAVEAWFSENYESATECQIEAWPAIQKNKDVLVAAPTGSGKTLAAFLAVINELVRKGLESSSLESSTYVVYVSPLKALSYDINRNLEAPLKGIREKLKELGYSDLEISAGVRTGDTSQSERRAMIRKPPHILVTTPESLYLLLTSKSGRGILKTTRKLIVDEIHSIVNNKRGAHFALSMARLERVVDNPIMRIGLSATQRPVDEVARFLCGRESHGCVICDTGHIRHWDLSIEIPPAPLEAVMSAESWNDVYCRIAELVAAHKTTLIFVNTRRHSERATRYLAELLGEENVAAHHGSLSKEHRHTAERRLKSGELKVVIATASLELGIDIGDVNLVCQIGSPRSISTFVQRVGRSGHSLGKLPKGILHPTTRDELVESTALLKAVHDGEMEVLSMCGDAMDVLAQQIVAECSVEDCNIDGMHKMIQTAFPYRDISLSKFESLLVMLSEGFSLRCGRRGAYIHLDAVGRMARGRKGARIVALTNGGAIPDQFDYDVILVPDEIRIGSVNEDFAFESLTGDIFQLGNASYRVLQVKQGRVLVEDAQGLPPNIPFWLGEGRGRSDTLSDAVSQLRDSVSITLDDRDIDSTTEWFTKEYQVDLPIAKQVVKYLALAKSALGNLPTKDLIIFERFFDEANDMHLVVHSVYGSRTNRAWGLALRKKFCVRFDFELQAAALEDNLVLSLGPTHSFELHEVQNYLNSKTSRQTLTQAIFTAPMFETRWRWVANTALAVQRNRNGKKVPPQLQRTDAEDLLALLFPDQVACQENRQGPINVPDHPLIKQTIEDCLHEVMDADGLDTVLAKIESGEIEVQFKDLSEPSILAQEILTAKPYAFLDDAPAEERRTLAVQHRRMSDIAIDEGFGQLDSEVIYQVLREMWPTPENEHELHDALVMLGFMLEREVGPKVNLPTPKLTPPKILNPEWVENFDQLVKANRATRILLTDDTFAWVPAERLHEFQLIHPSANQTPQIKPTCLSKKNIDTREEALDSLLRSRLEVIGPVSEIEIACDFKLDIHEVQQSLIRLESEGSILRGHYREKNAKTNFQLGTVEWCDRRILSRIHKRTLQRLRKEIRPVSKDSYIRYLMQWMRIDGERIGEGVNALDTVLDQLEGFEAPAAAWESKILPSRIYNYSTELLNHLSASGTIVWSRLSKFDRPKPNKIRKLNTSLRTSPLAFLRRQNLPYWRMLNMQAKQDNQLLSPIGKSISELLKQHGALFIDEILELLHLLPSHVEAGLVELFTAGVATCDHFGGIRALMLPESVRSRRHKLRYSVSSGLKASGRWSLVHREILQPQPAVTNEQLDEFAVKLMLKRYGVVFRAVLARDQRILSPWGRLLPILRRMEDRGEVRGGRFVTGISGEQFALPHALEMLRQVRRGSTGVQRIVISAADPLNMVGIVTDGMRIPSLNKTDIEFTNGICTAIIQDGQRQLMENLATLLEGAALKD